MAAKCTTTSANRGRPSAVFLAVSCSVGLFVGRAGLGGLWITQSLKQRAPFTLLLSFPQPPPPLLFSSSFLHSDYAAGIPRTLSARSLQSGADFLPSISRHERATATAYFLGSIILHNQTVVRSDTCVFLRWCSHRSHPDCWKVSLGVFSANHSLQTFKNQEMNG